MKKYLVYSKGDDYGHCLTELVETTPTLVEQYYGYKEIDQEDVGVLAGYFRLVQFSEEKERTSDRRFYGADD